MIFNQRGTACGETFLEGGVPLGRRGLRRRRVGKLHQRNCDHGLVVPGSHRKSELPRCSAGQYHVKCVVEAKWLNSLCAVDSRNCYWLLGWIKFISASIWINPVLCYVMQQWLHRDNSAPAPWLGDLRFAEFPWLFGCYCSYILL